MFKNRFTKKEWSWILYDWANSAYSMTVTSAILPIYFTAMVTAAGKTSSAATSLWGYTNSIASIIVALLSPILGAWADQIGMKKKLFTVFSFMGIIFTGLLGIVPYGKWIILMIFYILTVLGFSLGNVFYDSFLTDVTEDERMDQVSTTGFALGYIGSTIPFILCMALIILSQKEIIPLSVNLSTKISFIITAIWWFVFTLPMYKEVEQVYGVPSVQNHPLNAFRDLKKSFIKILGHKRAFYFLIAYFFYIDGVDTIIKMATSYGTALGLSATVLLLVLLLTQFVAFPFAIIYGKLSKKYGPKFMIYVGVVIYTIICIYAYFIKTPRDFFILAFLVGTSQGGIQAISRSYFARLIPKENSNEYFGFYNIFGKFAAIMGPFLVGFITQITGEVRNGVLSLIVLFILGFIFLNIERKVNSSTRVK
ncbi:MFS transporter [Lagierella sp.]|uniref:MFS transporter n=1 Tax=Lagierella sp. TaxID=2849657 RepID=UPI002638CD6B|nr:MFS transporter [Lagierella sp.]